MCTLSDVIQLAQSTFSTVYTGPRNDDAEYSCNLIASRHRDIFNRDQWALTRKTQFDYPLMDITADMISHGYILVWYGPSWGILGISHPEQMLINQLPDGLLIWMPSTRKHENGLTIDQVRNIYLYLNKNIQLFSWSRHYLHICPVSIAKDICYLYPITYKTYGRYILFSSTSLFDKQLIHAVNHQEMVYPMRDINELQGSYAAWLTMESTGLLYDIQFYPDELRISNVGYTSGNDILEQYTNILTDIVRDGMVFVKTTLEKAKQVSGTRKSFIYDGQMYTALLSTDNQTEYTNEEYQKCPLPSNQLFIELGYRPVISLEYTLPELTDLPERQELIFQTTHGGHAILGSYDTPQEKEALIEGYTQGKYFSRKFLAIVQCYPGFVPNIDPRIFN